MSIEICNVKKQFGSTVALDGVSLTLPEHRIYGLLGNNGAGKTTLLSILTDRLLASDGYVLVDGENVRNNDRALRKLFFAGDQNLFPDGMKVRKALNAVQEFYPDFDRPYAEEIAGRFGLNLKKKISALSTGYASVFRLVLGLSVNVPYLIFDEPVLGLDAQNRDLFYRLLMEKAAETSCTVILSTHLIAEAANLVDHTLIIRNGRILKNAPTDELTANVCSISGPAGALDAYLASCSGTVADSGTDSESGGLHVLSCTSLGGLKTACVENAPNAPLPPRLERSAVNLQDYFISLMDTAEKEERK